MNTGSCLCGNITWQIDAAPDVLSSCHCSRCRKSHGMAFATYVGVPVAAFRWTSGEASVEKYASSEQAFRPFCPRCGSVVPTLLPSSESAIIPAGGLDGPLGQPPHMHYFVGSKAPWFEISDGGQQFDPYPGAPEGADDGPLDRPPATSAAIGGSCLCNAVAFEFDEPLDRMGYCHCSRCRKSRSAAHSAQLFVAADKFRWLRGEKQVCIFKLPESQFFYNAFCETCGSLMPMTHEAMGVVLVPAGALDQDPGLRPQAHIFVGSKADWVAIADGLPQSEAMS